MESPCKGCGRLMDMNNAVWIGRRGFYCTSECVREAEDIADSE